MVDGKFALIFCSSSPGGSVLAWEGCVPFPRLQQPPWFPTPLIPHPSSSPFPYYLRRCCGPVICRKLTSAEQVWNPYDPFRPLVPLELNIQCLSTSTIHSLFEAMLMGKIHHCLAHNQRGAY